MSNSKAPMRLRGTLRFGERGAILEGEDGMVWRLETDDDISAHAGSPVLIEGAQRGPYLLELLWIGPATD